MAAINCIQYYASQASLSFIVITIVKTFINILN